MTIDEAIEHAKDISKKVNCKECADEHEQLVKWLEEFKHYKELEEQRRLIELPCATGDDIYFVPSKDEYHYNRSRNYRKNKVFHRYVNKIVFIDLKHWYIECFKYDRRENGKILADCLYGETWFLLREEAQAKLNQMELEEKELLKKMWEGM